MIPGLALVGDGSYIEAMHGVNSVIRNAPFGIAFFGSMVAIVATLSLRRGFQRRTTTALIAVAAALYLFVLVVTFTVHIPMNRELLAVTDLTTERDLSAPD
jgi:uncharacterized membrane protein